MAHEFRFSVGFTIICLLIAAYLESLYGVLLVILLGIMEVSFSFDNAVVNAAVLKKMSDVWQRRFLTWGILIAVFGMRLLLPIAIVAGAAHLNVVSVAEMAVQYPSEYQVHLESAHYLIAMFGGTFLLLVALSFLLDESRETYWLGIFEKKLQSIGKINAISVNATLLLTMIIFLMSEAQHQADILLGGLFGVLVYGLISSLDAVFENRAMAKGFAKSGALSFLYLEVLDSSFSLDGVIGAFAITQNVLLIMLGLGIGAVFVRSLTILLVKRGTLGELIYLEHGAHYAIGILAMIMLATTLVRIPEMFTGLIGISLITLSFLSSIRHKAGNKFQITERTGEL